MLLSCLRLLKIVVALLCSAAVGNCADLDYVAGIGDFERSSATKWYTDYTGSDYDFYARPGATRIDETTRKGFYDPLPDDSVADGWGRLVVGCSGPTKWNNIKLGDVVCRISKGAGVNGTNCQYFAIKGVGGSSAALNATVCVSGQSFTPTAGDRLIFRVDQMKFEDYDQVPVRFSLTLTCGGQSANQTLTPSDTPISGEVSLTLNGPASEVTVSIGISSIDDLGGHQPGIYVDGAHLFVRRAGSDANLVLEEIMPGRRGIRTIRTWYDTTGQSAVEVARNYDLVVIDASSYRLGTILRKVSPTIRVYCYQPVYAVDRRDLDGRSPYFPHAPVDFNTVLNHTDWLYAKPDGGYYADTKYNPPLLYVRLTAQDYRDAWTQSVLSFARKFGFDGVFVDTCGDIQPPVSPPTRMPWEVQQFAHDVFPKLKAAGLSVIQNGSRRHRVKGPGEPWWESGYVWHDINWTPTPDEVAQGYAPNSAAKLSNGHFQEGAFFYCASASGEPNVFSSSYWMRCLEDMDVVKQWNTGPSAPPDNHKQWEHMLLWGRDYPAGSAYGTDGWLQFGLCSYLLAQNNWTTFGWVFSQDITDVPRLDLSITANLGEPLDGHVQYGDDPYFRYRRYGPSVAGAAGGVVVVNANTDSPRTFKLDFDGTDESGEFVTIGQDVVIKPHTGRIFLKQKGPVFVRIRTPSDSVASGEVVTVTVDYLSSSTESALNVVLRATVPSEMSYVPGSAEISGGSYNSADNTVTWKIGTVVAGHSGRRTFKAAVK